MQSEHSSGIKLTAYAQDLYPIDNQCQNNEGKYNMMSNFVIGTLSKYYQAEQIKGTVLSFTQNIQMVTTKKSRRPETLNVD